MRRLLIVFFVLSLCSAAFAAHSVAPKKTQPGKSVGVITDLGDVFTLRKVGIMVFGNEEKEIRIDGWGINDLVVQQVGNALGKRFSIRRVAYPKGTFDALDHPKFPLLPMYDQNLKRIVRELASHQKADFYVVVRKASSQVVNTNQRVSGLGILERGGVILYALSEIRVYDGHTFAELKNGVASMGQSTFMETIMGAIPVHGPYRRVDRTWWPEPSQAAQSAKLRDATRELVQKSLAATLPGVLTLE